MCTGGELLAIQGGGVGAEAIGGFYTAKAQKYALKGQAAIDEANARMSELSAKTTLLSGQRAEQNVRLQTAALKATQRNNIAANGFDLGSDSARAILNTTDILGEVDANAVAFDAISQAWGYRMEGTNYSNKALTARSQASAISPWSQAGTTLLTGGSKVAANKYIMTKYGATG